jgi:hypothetical protein
MSLESSASMRELSATGWPPTGEKNADEEARFTSMSRSGLREAEVLVRGTQMENEFLKK